MLKKNPINIAPNSVTRVSESKRNVLFRLSLADSFTILNGIFGFLSILLIIKGETYFAFVLILVAVLSDGMDGIMARKYGGYLGRYMDEFSDIVSFCIAPSIFAYIMYDTHSDIVFIFATTLFLVFGMLHLINYHINIDKNYFIGIPTPAAAIIVISCVYLEFPFFVIDQ